MKDRSKIIETLGLPSTKLDPFESLSSQCQAEYNLSWRHQKPKKDEAEVRLKLYNNQKRNKDAVGDVTLFTIHQTVLASLYIDRLNVAWEGREEGDEETADNLNALSQNDYEEMEKDISDYDWDWDTLFFGRGLLALSEYIREPANGIYLPLPQVIDPIPFLRDPRAVSVNGDRFARGSARFFGWEEKMTKKTMEDHSHIFSDIKFEDLKFGSGTQSILRDAIEARDTARGTQTQRNEGEKNLGVNAEYDITRWYTHVEVGEKIKKVIVYLANDRGKVVGVQILKHDYWPIIDRPLYPTSHDWDGTSIPDLIEDKQRARAVAQNLGLDAMKADLYPMYIYDSNRVTNRKDLDFNFNKFIPIDGKDRNVADAIMPLIKSRPNMGLLDFIYNSLDTSAQKATGTPELRQGMLSEKQRTLGEINIIASESDTRYSLSAKVFGWSEKRFWRQWYQLYKDNFKEDIDEKVLRITGAFGSKWRPLKRDNIVTKIDPDVKIESEVMNRAKQLEERNALTGYFALALQEPTSNRRWGLKKLGRLNGLEKDEIDRLFPPTIEEREAEQENDKLNNDEFVPVLREQDHNVHLEIHAKANETDSTRAHISTHEKALMIKREAPELFPEEEQQTSFQPPGTKPLLGPETPADTGGITPSQTSGIS